MCIYIYVYAYAVPLQISFKCVHFLQDFSPEVWLWHPFKDFWPYSQTSSRHIFLLTRSKDVSSSVTCHTVSPVVKVVWHYVFSNDKTLPGLCGLYWTLLKCILNGVLITREMSWDQQIEILVVCLFFFFFGRFICPSLPNRRYTHICSGVARLEMKAPFHII